MVKLAMPNPYEDKSIEELEQLKADLTQKIADDRAQIFDDPDPRDRFHADMFATPNLENNISDLEDVEEELAKRKK